MFLWICIAVGVILLDQLTKWLAIVFLENGPSVPVISWFIQFSYVENTGAAWGMFGEPGQRWIFLTLSSIAIVAILLYVFIMKPKSLLLRISLAFIVGGGIGNMIDRVLLGYVVDFLEFTFIEFPVFNVADSFVCIGAAMMVLYIVLDTIKEYKNGKQKADIAEGDRNGGGDEA